MMFDKTYLGFWPFLFVMTLLCVQAEEHLPPSPEWTAHAEMEARGDSRQSAIFSYGSEQISLDGKIEFSSADQRIRFFGTYQSHQLLEDGIQLAFHLFGPGGQLLFREGSRTPLEQKEDFRQAEFEYAYSLSELGLPGGLDEFHIKFNYVLEGAYWIDLIHPETELPSIHVTNLDRGEQFSIRFSLLPRLVARNSRHFAFHGFTSENGRRKTLHHRASLEVLAKADQTREEQPRYRLTGQTGQQNHLKRTDFAVPETGWYSLRLGFVWDGVQWYPFPESQFRTVLVIPQIHFLCLVMGFLGLAIWLHARWRKRRKPGFSWSGLIVLVSVPALVSWLALGALLVACVGTMAAIFIAGVKWSSHLRIITIMAVFIFTQLWILEMILTGPAVRIQGHLVSLGILMLGLTPLFFVRNRSLLRWTTVPAVVLLSFYAVVLKLHYAFFQDYPSIHVVAYASQSLSLLDSVIQILDEQYLILLANACLTIPALFLASQVERDD